MKITTYSHLCTSQLKAEPDVETLTAMLESFSELIALGNESDAAKLTGEQLQSAAQV